MPKASVCAEIGVWKGEYSKKILEVVGPERLHLIDPWTFQDEYPQRWYGGRRALSQGDMDDVYRDVSSMFQDTPGVIIHRGYSEAVLEGFEDDYFDWVYIDGNHSYEYVLRDLELALQKVKPGGFITGDDYVWGEKDGFPVKRAIQRFVNANDLGDQLEVLHSQFIISI